MMSIIKWEPFEELATMRRQMDRLMESFWGREPFAKLEGKWTPAIDVIEDENEILVKIEVPGMDQKDISIQLSGDNLIVKGERKEEKEEKKKHYHRMERWSGAFQRIIALPVGVDAEQIKANYHKGLLNVHLPKKPEVKPKEIPITIK
ncbi:MAG: Hsp20/alpha crystallin family protein [bacterium]|nr:MAG: Hsp20/alpha crystallin family protein [bacterium]